MARIIYKKGLEGQNRLECIDGIEINMLNGQCALIYPKYAELPLLDKHRIDDWKAKTMTEIEALKVEDSASATDELLALDSSAAKFVRQFKSDVYGHFNLPTLLAAMEIAHQREDINKLAKTIEGAELLREGVSVSSCSRYDRNYRWIAVGNNIYAVNYGLNNSVACVPLVLYRKAYSV